MLIEIEGNSLKITTVLLTGDYPDIQYISLTDVDMEIKTRLSNKELVIRENEANIATVTDKDDVTNISSTDLEDLADQIYALIKVGISIIVTPSPLRYVEDTVSTQVELDTATATNNKPLPIQLLDRLKGFLGIEENPLIVDFKKDDKDLYENLKVAQPSTVFDITFENHKQVDLWETVLVAGGTEGYLGDKGVRTLSTTTASGDAASLIQHGYNQFIEGKEFEVNFALGFGDPKVGVEKRFGYFDTDNGFYFKQTSAGYFVGYRTNVTGTPVDTTVPRLSWNIDKLDGNGPSGLTQGVDIDIDNFGRFEIITQGTVGKTQYAIDLGGEAIKLHEVNFDWTQTTAYLERASLPICFELENTALAPSATTIEIQACAVKIFGDYDITGFPFSASTAIATRLISTRTAIIGMRIKQSFGPGAKIPRGVVQLSSINIAVSGGDVLWEIILQKGHLGEANIGGAPTWTGINRSTVEFTVDGTTVPLVTPTAGGEALQQGYAIAATGNNPGDRVQLTGNIVHNIALNNAGTQSDYAILVATPKGNNANIEGAAMVWTEFK